MSTVTVTTFVCDHCGNQAAVVQDFWGGASTPDGWAAVTNQKDACSRECAAVLVRADLERRVSERLAGLYPEDKPA